MKKDGPPLNIKISKKDHQRLLNHAEKASLPPSTLARQYIIQRMDKEEKNDK